MAILPATIFNQNSNPLDAIFSQATNGLQSSLNAAIQRGQQIASTQLQQENAFLQERQRQQALEDRKAQNIRDIFNEERTLANKNTIDQYQIINNDRIQNRGDRTLNLEQQDAARLSAYMNDLNALGNPVQGGGGGIVGGQAGPSVGQYFNPNASNSAMMGQQKLPYFTSDDLRQQALPSVQPSGLPSTQLAPLDPSQFDLRPPQENLLYKDQSGSPAISMFNQASQPDQRSEAGLSANSSVQISSPRQGRKLPEAPILSTNQGVANLFKFQDAQAKQEEALALAQSGLTSSRSGRGRASGTGGKGAADQTIKLNDLEPEKRAAYLSLASTDKDAANRFLITEGVDASEIEKLDKIIPKNQNERLSLVNDSSIFGESPEKEVRNIAVRYANALNKFNTSGLPQESKERTEAIDAQALEFAKKSPRVDEPISEGKILRRANVFKEVQLEFDKLASLNPKSSKETPEEYADRLTKLYYAGDTQQQAQAIQQAVPTNASQTNQPSGYKSPQAEKLGAILQRK